MSDLLHDLEPRTLVAALILKEADMLDEKRLRLLKVAAQTRDPVDFARHMVKLSFALKDRSPR